MDPDNLNGPERAALEFRLARLRLARTPAPTPALQ